MKVRLTLKEELLGTSASDPKIHETYIASKAPSKGLTEEEVESLEDFEATPSTVFPRDENGKPFWWDYQIKGFFKDACGMLKRCPDTKSAKLTAYKKVIDGLVFISERKIPFQMTGEIDNCQRPLRAQTAQGERIAIAHSETVPAGTVMEFEIVCFEMKPVKIGKEQVKLEDFIVEWLNYGKFRGLGQWRNSGKGSFTWERV
jgi:hypothetical protein